MDLISRKAVSDLLFKLGCDLKPEDQAVIIVALGMIKGLPSFDPEEPCNCPLTWEQLKTMEGKPVWIEVDGKRWGRFWAFVEVGNDSYINFYQKGQEYPEDLWKCNMGKAWNAFRNEVQHE